MQSKTSNSGCNGAKQGSNCVIWTGQSIPALGIEKGDSITDIVCTIAQQVVTLAAPLDLSTVSIQCLIDNLNISEPAERTIANMLQIAYDSSCNLNDAVEAINAKLSNTTPSLVLNLGCLATFDVYGNPLPYNEQSVLQTLINTACGQASTIAGISGTVQTIQAAVTALQAIPQYTEPLLSSCIYSATKTSSALQITAAALCSYQGEVGQVTDIQSALAKMPTAFTTAYGLINGWIVNPTNFAQSYSNSLLVIADLYNQIKSIQNTCCQVSCSSIAVDFDIKLSPDRTSATLFFATKSSVPAGFTEVNPLGDLLTITDSEGNEYTIYVNVIQQLTNPNGIIIDLSATAIDPNADYTFGMTVSLTNGTLTCVKCISHTATFKDTCAFCTISVTSPTSSSNDYIVITYTSGSSQVQYATIHANQTQAIPTTAMVNSLAVFGNATYTTTCTLPQPSLTSCYEMDWAISNSSGGHDAVFTDASLQWISVLGVKYPISCQVGSTSQALCYVSAFSSFFPAVTGLLGNLQFNSSATNMPVPTFNGVAFQITFVTTAAIAASMQGFISASGSTSTNGQFGLNDGFAAGAYITPIPSTASSCAGAGGGSQQN